MSSIENYTIGSGRLSLAKYDPASGVAGDERWVGNVPDFSYNVDISTLDHFESYTNKKALDKVFKLSTNLGISITLDERSVKNMQLSNQGNLKIESENNASFELSNLTNSGPLTYVDVGHRGIGTWKLEIGAVTDGPFVPGETITGGTSSATAKVVRVFDNVLHISHISGTFAAAETITGGTSTGTATTTAVPVFEEGLINVEKSGTPDDFYVVGDDYVVEARAGRILIADSGSITANDTLNVYFSTRAREYQVVTLFTDKSASYKVRFVSDNANGLNIDLVLHKVDLVLEGDVALISNELSTVTLTGRAMFDSLAHPDDPVGSMTFID